MDITVIRGEGDHPGDDVVDPLMATLDAALSRGRAELDEGALSDQQELTTVMTDLRLGQTIEVDDAVLGRWRGKLTSLSHSVQVDDQGNLSGESRFTLRKPR
jgi:hypothetical protein